MSRPGYGPKIKRPRDKTVANSEIEFPSTGDYDLFLSLGKLDDAKLSWTKFSDGRWSATFTVTNHRAYCDAQGQWHDHNGHYRLNDLQTLIYALQKAHAWIMDQRDLNVPL
jgi:hypothetical protein